MKPINHVGVIDIGKTNAKVAVVDVEQREEIGVLKRSNIVLCGPPYPHYDIDGHWRFVCAGLGELHREYRIDAISVTTHGASAVLLDAEGGLAAPVLDYEFDGPDRFAEEYDAIRPEFSETGSPRLGMGLNVGAQLFWQLKSVPDLRERLAAVLTYPQYWAYRLTGILANEVTSLGCHTDLWCPAENRYSSLVDKLGLSEKMAPVKRAADCLGTLLPEISEQVGLPACLPVSCGIHDSNASLFPHLLKRKAPFSVVSTGTWVIALSIGGDLVALDSTRDTLVNVNAFGDPVPSARFMGGREFDMILEGHDRSYCEADIASVLERDIMLLPAVDPRSGPFQGRQYRWSIDDTKLTDGERFVALSFYLSLVTAECLDMISSQGPTIVEGPFAQNRLYLDMLETATGRPVEAAEGSVTGTCIGAALLVAGLESKSELVSSGSDKAIQTNPSVLSYAAKWQALVRQKVGRGMSFRSI